jgi:hypothetical protein
MELAVVIGFGILGPILGYWVYRRADRHARTVGSLADF